MRYLIVLLIMAVALIPSSCISSSISFKKKQITQSSYRTTPSANIEKKKSATRIHDTFLDTLNRDNEIVLTDNDFEKETIPSESVVSNDALPESLYRIQVFASNSIEAIREQKKELEKNTDESVQIGYDAPYYKLYAGGFIKKQEASFTLSKLKKIGYVDAWIVSTKVQQ